MFPVAEIFVVHEFDAREPFGHFHAVTAGHEDAERKAMLARERRAVNVVGEKIRGIGKALDGMAGGVAFGGIEDGVFGGRKYIGALDERFKQRASPLGVADEAAANGVGNTFKSEDGFEGREGANFVIGQFEGIFHQAVDGEGPFFFVDGGLAMRGGEVEIFGRGNGAEGGLRPVFHIIAHAGVADVCAAHEVAIDDAGNQQTETKASGDGDEVAAFHGELDERAGKRYHGDPADGQVCRSIPVWLVGSDKRHRLKPVLLYAWASAGLRLSRIMLISDWTARGKLRSRR